MNAKLLMAFAALLTGCATDSGPVSLGGDEFMIALTQKGFRGSAAPVRARAIQDADAFCRSQGKAMLLVKTVQKDMKPFRSDAAAEVYFRCVGTNDPALKEPTKVEEIRE